MLGGEKCTQVLYHEIVMITLNCNKYKELRDFVDYSRNAKCVSRMAIKHFTHIYCIRTKMPHFYYRIEQYIVSDRPNIIFQSEILPQKI